MKKRVLVATILIGILFCMSSAVVQAAGDFLGDLCWSVDDGSGDGPTLKLGVFHIGGGHYQLLGTLQHSTDGTYIAQGNAELIENKIHISIIMADGNNNAMSTLHALGILDPSTLSGSYNMLHTGASKTGQTEIHYSSGTLNLIPCQ